MKNMFQGSVLVTGGAGFIGSHIVNKLIKNDLKVTVIDNLSNGTISNLSNNKDDKNLTFKKYDLKNIPTKNFIESDVETVFHLAANPEVRIGVEHPEISFEENILTTFNLLESIRKSNVKTIIFTSTSTVYGEPDIIPTSETYGPLLPISQYGSTKLACEGLISSYCQNYGIDGTIVRLANVIGKRSNHGVIVDFIKKLKHDKNNLEVLGDGTQSKSYIHVDDCVDCLFFCRNNQQKSVDVFNLGNDDRVNVLDIAKKVCQTLELHDTNISTSGGVDHGRGWIGDVKIMQLDFSKLKKLGWKPKLTSEDAVNKACQELVKELVRDIVGN